MVKKKSFFYYLELIRMIGWYVINWEQNVNELITQRQIAPGLVPSFLSLWSDSADG